MSWWSHLTGPRPVVQEALRGEDFVARFAPQGHLQDAEGAGVSSSSRALAAFEQIESKSEQLKVLAQLSPVSRHALLARLNAVERDQLLGGTAFDASLHHTGPAFAFDWDTFAPQETKYSPQNAHAMAIAAKRVYEPPEAIKREYEAQGFDVQVFDRDGTQAFLATRGDVAILSFRGTEPERMEDLLTDAQVCLTPAHGGKVHDGFSKGLDAVWGDINKALESSGVRGGKPLFVTGHSLGAALGTLAAARLESDGIVPKGLYTFGSPRVGDEAFAASFQRSEMGQRTWRFRNNNDGVTTVPPHGQILGYSHVGTEVYFDNDGKAHNEPDEATVCADRREAIFSPVQSYFLKKYTRMKNNDNNPGEHLESMWDHGMTGYVKHVFVNQDFQANPSDTPKN